MRALRAQVAAGQLDFADIEGMKVYPGTGESWVLVANGPFTFDIPVAANFDLATEPVVIRDLPDADRERFLAAIRRYRASEPWNLK